jgi:hypothetical protein
MKVLADAELHKLSLIYDCFKISLPDAHNPDEPGKDEISYSQA